MAEQTQTEKVRVYKLSPGWSPIVFTDFDRLMQDVRDMIENSEIGDEVLVQIDEMTQDEFDNLPEHEGW
jgi:hypothetical protein